MHRNKRVYSCGSWEYFLWSHSVPFKIITREHRGQERVVLLWCAGCRSLKHLLLETAFYFPWTSMLPKNTSTIVSIYIFHLSFGWRQFFSNNAVLVANRGFSGHEAAADLHVDCYSEPRLFHSRWKSILHKLYHKPKLGFHFCKRTGLILDSAYKSI